jgi:hypothetical protein
MQSKQHSISIEVSPSDVFEAISTLGGLRSWWTNAIAGNPDKNGELVVTPGVGQRVTFAIPVLKKNGLMTLLVTEETVLHDADQREALVGTSISIKLSADDTRSTALVCTHEGWEGSEDFYTICSTQWETRLASLKKLCETGKGDPEIIAIPRK